MIDIETKFSGDLDSELDKFEARIKGAIILSGVAAAANVIYERVKANAPISERAHFFKGQNQTYGPYQPGSLQRAIYRAYAKERSSDGHQVYVVRWRTQKPPIGVPYGFMVEYGTSKISANPFMRRALSQMPTAIKAGMTRMSERMLEEDWNRLASGEN